MNFLSSLVARTMRRTSDGRLSRVNGAEAVHLRGERSAPLTCLKYFSNNLHGVISIYISINCSNAERVANRLPRFEHYSNTASHCEVGRYSGVISFSFLFG